MVNLVITSIVLIVIMLAFVFLLLKNIVKKIDDNAKKYFVDKMQDYDYILEKKQDDLNQLNERIEVLKSESKNILKDYVNINEEKINGIHSGDKNVSGTVSGGNNSQYIKYDLNIPEYRDASKFFKSYKKIRKIFSINNELIIQRFVERCKNPKNERIYNALKEIRDKFDNNAIYSCLTLQRDEQIKMLKELLTAQEKNYIDFDEIIHNEKFDINYLINHIENKMEKYDPNIYVYVNEANINYNYIDKNVITKQYSNMAEGIIIQYKNKIYDFSI